jgi:hypothetical protein
MAANDIEYFFNQPIQMYKVTPTDAEKENGLTAWSETAYHKRLGNCYFVDVDYCHPVKDTDYMTFQFKAATTGSELLLSSIVSLASDDNTGVTALKLVDAAADFITAGVGLNNLVLNTTDNLSSYVDNVDSLTQLTLANDIFTASPKGYIIYNININGNWEYNVTTDSFFVDTAASGGIEFANILTVGSWYAVTIAVTDLTAGSLAIKLGNATIANISSVGTHTVYGQCTVVTDFTIQASASFIGTVDMINCSIYELQTNYTIALFDLNNVYIDSFGDAFTDGLTIGNVVINLPWNSFALTCGQYVVGVFVGDVEPCGQMIRNGNFANAAGWATDTGITITGGHAEFSTVTDGNGLSNTLTCSIISGHEYTLTWDISSLLGTKTGAYFIKTAEGTINPPFPYDVSTQTGTITLVFTASADSTYVLFECSGASTTFQLDNVSLVDNNPVLVLGNADGLSECYCYCDQQECTVLVQSSASQPTFGNFYDTDNDRNYLRIPGRLRNQVINDLEFNAFKSTLDTQVQPYMNLNKIEEFATSDMPEWVHNSLAIALSHPIVWIDGVKYVRTGAYSPDWGEGELTKAIVNVAKVNQSNMRNNY